MSLMNALLETYNFALDEGLVDNHKLSTNGQVLLPIYHSNRRSNNDDIFEITVDENSNAIAGKFLDKDEFIIFPITEDSIIRSGSKIAPHPICDELSYLAKEISKEKNQEYIEGINKLLDYERLNSCENFRIIGEYIKKNIILDDFLKYYLGNTEYQLDNKFKLKYDVLQNNGTTKTITLDLNKIFITFKIEKILEGDISITKDVDIHDFYIEYVDHVNKNRDEFIYCDITGELDYCITRHRGLLGTAKVISISNRKETYYGRLKRGEDIYHVSYAASQKIHNMLKFFLDNNNYHRYIGENAYIINWLSQDLDKGGIELISNLDDDYEDVEELTMSSIGGDTSAKLGKYFLGDKQKFVAKGDFYVLIVEKVSNGRISIKYFKRLSRAEAYDRVMNWYNTTSWKFYNKYRSPSIYEIVNFAYGGESSKGYLSCENKKLMRSSIERLLPCIIDGKRIPRDMLNIVFYKLSNKRSYKESWNAALNRGCSLIKKYKNDYDYQNIEPDKINEVEQLEESRSFYYGKLMAIYEKIELDAIRARTGGSEGKKKSLRITNADRLWNSIIRTPERTRFILESKIKPYMNILKRNNPGGYIFFDKLITEITLKLLEFNENNTQRQRSLNEDFILGYYYQKNDFYSKKDKDVKVLDNK